MEVSIIGAGLTGLATAYYLKKRGITAHIYEARERVGGRIYTQYKQKQASLEMGATWLGLKHRHLINLLEELGLEIFEQYTGDTAIYEAMSTSPPQMVQLPPNPAPSYRIKGGTSALIHALVDELPEETLHLNETLQSVSFAKQKVHFTTDKGAHSADRLITTLPPFLFYKAIEIQPKLPAKLASVAQQTHTWMGESIKVGLRYVQPFWQAKSASGTLFSNVGPITEMYDHSNAENEVYALKGFMNPAFAKASLEERKARILTQLKKYYGSVVYEYLAYKEVVWSEEPFTFQPYDASLLPHQSNGNTVFRIPYFEGRLWVAGSETAVQFPGYMEGAVGSAMEVSNQIVEELVKTKTEKAT